MKIMIRNKIGNFIRKKLRKIKRVKKNMVEESKLTLYMKENDISEDYILGLLAKKPEYTEESDEEGAEDEETEEPEAPTEIEITTELINDIVDSKIKSALKVKRKAPPKQGDHNKKTPDVMSEIQYEAEV